MDFRNIGMEQERAVFERIGFGKIRGKYEKLSPEDKLSLYFNEISEKGINLKINLPFVLENLKKINEEKRKYINVVCYLLAFKATNNGNKVTKKNFNESLEILKKINFLPDAKLIKSPDIYKYSEFVINQINKEDKSILDSDSESYSDSEDEKYSDSGESKVENKEFNFDSEDDDAINYGVEESKDFNFDSEGDESW